MVPYLLDYTFIALSVALYLAIAVILIRKYRRTRDVGLLWLGTAIVLWPWMGEGIDLVITNRRAHSHLARHFPFSLVEHGQVSTGELFRLLYFSYGVVELGLLLVAVLYLYRSKSNANPAEA